MFIYVNLYQFMLIYIQLKLLFRQVLMTSLLKHLRNHLLFMLFLYQKVLILSLYCPCI